MSVETPLGCLGGEIYRGSDDILAQRKVDSDRSRVIALPHKHTRCGKHACKRQLTTYIYVLSSIANHAASLRGEARAWNYASDTAQILVELGFRNHRPADGRCSKRNRNLAYD